MDIETFQQQNQEFYAYDTTFHGRKIGAIGACEWFEYVLTSDTQLSYDQARLKLYENFEHISELKIHKQYFYTKDV